jgi:hypothetical protein
VRHPRLVPVTQKRRGKVIESRRRRDLDHTRYRSAKSFPCKKQNFAARP